MTQDKISGRCAQDKISGRCAQIADTVVPSYRAGKKNYSCAGLVAKRWQAAWDGAWVALGGCVEVAGGRVLNRRNGR
jgi:hypothetical protein